MTEYCICGHKLKQHVADLDSYKKEFCEECLFDLCVSDEYYVHEFKLDNLKLIEDTAKERKLI